MFQDVHELLVVESSSSIGGCTLEHDVNLFLGESVSHGGQILSQAISVDVSSISLIEGFESLQNFGLGVTSRNLVAHEGQEHGEVD